MYPLHLPGNRLINTERACTVQRLTDVMACIWLRGAQQRTSRTNNRHRVGLQNGSGLQSAAAAHRYRRAASERTRRDRSTGRPAPVAATSHPLYLPVRTTGLMGRGPAREYRRWSGALAVVCVPTAATV